MATGSDASAFSREFGYPAHISASSAWNMPPNAYASHSNVPFGIHYPNTLAFWHNPHSIRPSSEAHDFHAQTQIPQRNQEQKKHKRTKSGCFTCRSRRVKCDETRPICDRCSKGKRECSYPPAQMSKKESRSSMKMTERPPSIRECCELGGNDDASTTMNDSLKCDAPPSSIKKTPPPSAIRRKIRRSSETSTAALETKGISPGSDMSGTITESPSPVTSTDLDSQLTYALPDFPGLKPHDRFFIAYRRQNINYHHYLLKSHTAKFLNEDMLSYAMGYEPLLYAMIAFSAYHYSIGHPNGKIYTFLQYYNKSVSLLLKSLQGGDKHDDAMLLTILQLSTLEEFVGDWVNLIDHHQAAHRMLLELYTPQSIHVDSFRRHILLWYTRYDIMAGLMSGNSVILSREWYLADEEFSMQESLNDPHDLDKKIMAWGARHRRFGMDVASLFAKMSQGYISMEQFLIEKEVLDTSFEEQRRFLETMKDSRYLVLSYPHQKPLDADEIFDPYSPGMIYGDELWEINFCGMELVSVGMLYKYQTGTILQNLDYTELKEIALDQAQRIETLNRWPNKPEEMHLWFMSPLGMVVLFLPHDKEYNMWSRRKLARNEQLGYIYPPAFRMRLAELWKIPEVQNWWLPNDEGYPSVVRDVRAWTKERVTDARDTFREAVRDIKAVLGNMNLEDNSSAGSSPSANSTAFSDMSLRKVDE
ncbi:hypothetical protein LOZ51_005861 [Ophidiomyces ophidiicola]|nr:hypothetical protein LOZ55_003158 [Ophidiomyces ophidiicola]KAI1981797.1 hypothetical protein LOZ54_005513 [Ophidiomyces ophidiicola]KAI1987087.1 hypothetical protein LOZ51_005861 [Ophidiomyces ophidiicola]